MTKNYPALPVALILTLGFAAGSMAHAQEAAQGASSIFGPQGDEIQALTETDLQALTGMGADALETAIISSNEMVNTAGQVNANDLLSGEISFGDNALQNVTGMNNMVVNTGHGASVQGSMNVNIILK